jgi:hypothetical protein
MENFYDFNEDFDGSTAGIFRQTSTTSMQQPSDANVSASSTIATAASVATAVVSIK